MPIAKTTQDYHLLAQRRGFKWIGFPTLTNKKTYWQCIKIGHVWATTYSNIRRGRACPYCNGRARKDSTDYYTLAEKRGYSWMGPEVSNTRTKTRWKCKNGHIKTRTYDGIYHHDKCQDCTKEGRIK